nr:hypothetical protein [Tanacetum cinerariifolium]
NSLISQEASRSFVELEVIQEDTYPSKNTSQLPNMVEYESVEPQNEVILIRRSIKTHCAPDQMCLYVKSEEHALEDHNKPSNYNAALPNPGSEKWLEVINAEM